MNSELIRELRALTSAGMKDCKDALEEAGGDLQKAVDIIKVKGLAISDGRSGKVATEGRVAIARSTERELSVMVEVNCQTDFVANSPAFVSFTEEVSDKFLESLLMGDTFDPSYVEGDRKDVVASTKENVVVRRWWAEEGQDPTVRVFSYLHSNNQIGVLLTMKAPSVEAINAPDFRALGDDLTMQVCAMSPLSVSSERIAPAEKDRQKAIFEAQLREENKPEKMWEKIIEGKFRKWNTEVCLLEQESVIVAKMAVKQVIKNVGNKLGGEITVVNFVRCQVGEGLSVEKTNLAEEVSKMTGLPLEEAVSSQDLAVGNNTK